MSKRLAAGEYGEALDGSVLGDGCHSDGVPAYFRFGVQVSDGTMGERGCEAVRGLTLRKDGQA